MDDGHDHDDSNDKDIDHELRVALHEYGKACDVEHFDDDEHDNNEDEDDDDDVDSEAILKPSWANGTLSWAILGPY